MDLPCLFKAAAVDRQRRVHVRLVHLHVRLRCIGVPCLFKAAATDRRMAATSSPLGSLPCTLALHWWARQAQVGYSGGSPV